MKQKDFTHGKIFGPMFFFAIPIMLTNILQTLYGIADNIVVGKLSGDNLALAAVGTAGSISALILNFVLGLSVGSGVVISQAYGAKNHEKVSRGVHTAITFGALFGIVMGTVAFLLTPQMLIWTDVKEELMERATLYLRIIFAAYPATAVYNFAAAALRAVGDSRTSLRILALSGLLNVGLNLVFVLALGMSVGGVALATAISKYVSAIAIIIVLLRRRGESYAFSFAKMKISRGELLEILRFGVPNGIQNSMFSISSIFFTVAMNSLDVYVLGAKTIAMNLTGVANNVSSSYMNAMLTFSAQNYGAKKPKRIQKSLGICLLQGTVFTFLIGMAMYLLVGPISSLYISASDPARELTMACAKSIAAVTLPYYFLCSIMNATSGALRGIGYSTVPMISSIVGICGFRILWIMFAFPLEMFHSAWGIYLAFPLSWALVVLANILTLWIVSKGVRERLEREREEAKVGSAEAACQAKM